MPANLPVAFGALLVAGILLDEARKEVGSALSSSGAGAAGGAQLVTPGKDGGVNPFAKASGVSVGRVDMGVDIAARPGSPLLAIWRSKLVNIVPNWYQGQPQLVFQRLSDGRYWYAAEQIAPRIRVGSIVNAGEQIGTYAPSGTATEWGFAANASGQTLAQATGGYTEGQQTPAGESFLQALKALGL